MTPDWEAEVQAAFGARRPQVALDRLLSAERYGVTSGRLYREKALALRMLGRDREAVGALHAALVLDPCDFMARLSLGALLEQLGDARGAGEAYKAALALAPAADRMPPGAAAALERGRALVAGQSERLLRHIDAQAGPAAAALEGEAERRFAEARAIYSGVTRAYVQQPLLLNYPRLAAIPFYDRNAFGWLARLEAATQMITEELGAALAATDEFAPYINLPPGAPVNQWGTLNGSRAWSAFFLWRDGERQDAACALCPRTAALLEDLPMARQSGYAPTAMFSALEPHAHIPPHTGSANTRLLVHLPLIVPGPARFRVGNEVRPWRVGEAWVFDDTIEHEAWNDADETRVILILDIWNPQLTAAEQAAVEAMMSARRSFVP